MSDVTLRFAVIATPAGDGRAWAQQAARLEADGWGALLVPDTLATASPFVALAAAAAVTERIKLRTWVLAAPLRSPAATAREARALQELSDGRFEAGIGAGRPYAEQEAAKLGLPWPSPAERIEQVVATVTALRSEVRPVPPVAIAASGPRMTRAAVGALSAADASSEDRIVLAVPPTADESALAAVAAQLREAAGRPVPASLGVVAVGGQVSPGFLRWGGQDAAALAASDASGVLPPDPDEALAVLRGRAERFGIDELVVPADLAAAAAPLLQRTH